MAAIYKGQCTHCSYNTGLAVGGYLTVRLDNGEYKILPHPIERFALKEAGYTYDKAKRQKRLVWVKHFSCEHCGHISKDYTLYATGNCLVDCLLVALIYGLVLAVLPGSFLLRSLLACLLVYIKGQMISAWLRLRYKNDNRALPRLAACSTCRGQKFRELRSGHQFTCPQCQQATLDYEMVAKS